MGISFVLFFLLHTHLRSKRRRYEREKKRGTPRITRVNRAGQTQHHRLMFGTCAHNPFVSLISYFVVVVVVVILFLAHVAYNNSSRNRSLSSYLLYHDASQWQTQKRSLRPPNSNRPHRIVPFKTEIFTRTSCNLLLFHPTPTCRSLF